MVRVIISPWFWVKVVEYGASNAQAFYQFSKNTEMSSRRSRVICPRLRHAARFERTPTDCCLVVSLIIPMVPIGGEVFADHCCFSYQIYFLASTAAAMLILLIYTRMDQPQFGCHQWAIFQPYFAFLVRSYLHLKDVFSRTWPLSDWHFQSPITWHTRTCIEELSTQIPGAM